MIYIYSYIYIIVFFVSLWFQEKITWSPNWWQTMLLRCWLLWWLWHHPWHHADATSGSFWDKAGMGGWEYGTRLYEKKPFYRARCSGFLKNNISCVFFCVFFCLENLCDHFHASHSIGIPQQWYGPWKKIFSLQQMAFFLDFYMLGFTVGILSGIFWTPLLVPWHVFGVLRPHPWHLQPLDFLGDSWLSPTGTFLCPRNHLMQVLTLVAMEVLFELGRCEAFLVSIERIISLNRLRSGKLFADRYL